MLGGLGRITGPDDYVRIANELTGPTSEIAVAKLLQRRLCDLAEGHVPDGSPHRYIVCPQCGSRQLKHLAFYDWYKERMCFAVMCLEDGCKFNRAEFGAE
jgi:hypothetical protein